MTLTHRDGFCAVCSRPLPVPRGNAKKHCGVTCYLDQKQRLQNERRRVGRSRDREKGLAVG